MCVHAQLGALPAAHVPFDDTRSITRSIDTPSGLDGVDLNSSGQKSTHPQARDRGMPVDGECVPQGRTCLQLLWGRDRGFERGVLAGFGTGLVVDADAAQPTKVDDRAEAILYVQRARKLGLQ